METVQLVEELTTKVVRGAQSWAYLIFIFGATTALLYKLVEDLVDGYRTRGAWLKALGKAGGKGVVALGVLWLLTRQGLQEWALGWFH